MFVLNVLAFILVGLQLRGILLRLHGQIGHYALFAVAVLAAAVLMRVVWVTGYHWITRRKPADLGAGAGPPGAAQGGVVIAVWDARHRHRGGRALPAGFPGRDLLLFAAPCVVPGTLVVQGLTLRPLTCRLSLPRDESVENEVLLARAEGARAALKALDTEESTDRSAEGKRLLQREYQARLEQCAKTGGVTLDPKSLGALRQRALAAERAKIAALRR